MDWWTIYLTLIGGALCIYLFFTRHNKYFEKLGIPFLKPVPILGNMTKTILKSKAMPYVIQEVYDCHPEAKYVGLYDLWNPVILLKDPELIKSVTIKNFDNFPNHKMTIGTPNEPLFQKSLFSLKDNEWRDMRTILSPAFTSSKMKNMFRMMAECATNFADHLAELNPQPEELDMKDTFGRYTLDVIASTAFGLSVNSMKDRENEFYLLGKNISNFSGIRMLKFFFVRCFPDWLIKVLNIRFLDETTSNFFINTIKHAITTRDAQGIVRPDMIHLMMQARDKKENISIEDITAQAFIFLIAGFDSPAVTMSFAAHLLAVHPEIQSKLQAEIDEVLEQSSGEISYENLFSMKYLDAVVNETLRMFAPAVLMDRVGPKDFTLPPALPGSEPLQIKAGDNILIPMWSIHRDPKYFPDPEKFDPERFSEENKSKILPFTYFPFGLGPRSCIANRFALMEVKLALFHLLAKCNLLPTPKTETSITVDPKIFSLQPLGGFWLKIVPRKV